MSRPNGDSLPDFGKGRDNWIILYRDAAGVPSAERKKDGDDIKGYKKKIEAEGGRVIGIHPSIYGRDAKVVASFNADLRNGTMDPMELNRRLSEYVLGAARDLSGKKYAEKDTGRRDPLKIYVERKR